MKNIILILVAFIATLTGALNTVSAQNTNQQIGLSASTAKKILDRLKSHVPTDAQQAIDKAVLKQLNGGPNDSDSAAILLREAAGAEAVANNAAKPQGNRETAAEDAQALRFAAGILNGTATISTASSSSTFTMTASSNATTVGGIIRSGDHITILNRILAEDETLSQPNRDAIGKGILALKSQKVEVPRMWARGLNAAADIAHSRIGNVAYWTTRFGSNAGELLKNADAFAAQDEAALRAAATALSSQVTFVSYTQVVQAPVVVEKVVTTSKATATKASTKPTVSAPKTDVSGHFATKPRTSGPPSTTSAKNPVGK